MERQIVSAPDCRSRSGPTRRLRTLEDSWSSPASPTPRRGTRPARPSPSGRASSSRPDLVVSTTVLVADQSSFPELSELYAEFFPTDSFGTWWPQWS
jgi:hypothetical protein